MVVPYREEMMKRHLKVTGDLGRVTFIVWTAAMGRLEFASDSHRNTICATPSPSRRASVTPTLSTTLSGANTPRSECDAGISAETQVNNCRNFSYTDVHVDGAERIAEAVAKYDVDRFIHVSSYNASRDSPSEFFATKAWGEEVVRSIYPETTIVRPAPMFGFEDNLLHKLAGTSPLLVSNHMQERFWPVHVSSQLNWTRSSLTL